MISKIRKKQDPGTASGNWEWRFKWEQLRNTKKDFLRSLTKKYNRAG
jgi:4-alpha-glucanotransferase